MDVWLAEHLPGPRGWNELPSRQVHHTQRDEVQEQKDQLLVKPLIEELNRRRGNRPPFALFGGSGPTNGAAGTGDLGLINTYLQHMDGVKLGRTRQEKALVKLHRLDSKLFSLCKIPAADAATAWEEGLRVSYTLAHCSVCHS